MTFMAGTLKKDMKNIKHKLKQENRVFQRVEAKELWKKMLSMVFETGHPWITFKDVCNLSHLNNI